MWSRLLKLLRCPLCRGPIAGWRCETGQQLGQPAGGSSPSVRAAAVPPGSASAPIDPAADVWLDTGLLACEACRTWYPVVSGVPVLLPYATAVHHAFARDQARLIGSHASACAPPRGTPVRGEERVMRSFSIEWQEYDFDGVIWEMDYADHEARFLKEIGSYGPPRDAPGLFLEVGCGLGITTAMAARNFGSEAIGVDLSAAAWRASATNRDNPSLHFVQASVFALPFEPALFDTIYTRGVLHHTYSTADAYRAVAPLCKPGGTLYVWVYGPRSISDNLFRRSVYGMEVLMRFVLNRSPAWLSNAALAPLALSYVVFNRARRQANPRIQAYNYTRALHAARDRFTPEYAHRHDEAEVSQWFREAGYVDIEVVDWRSMPSADHDDYRRNTGVRGRRAALAAPGRSARPAAPASHDTSGMLVVQRTKT